MSDQHTNDFEDEVSRRLAAIVESKRRQNEEIIGRLRGLDERWEGLNKELDVDIGTEFDLASVEKEEAVAAKEKLAASSVVANSGGFVLGGRIVDRKGKTGLPGVAVRIIRGKGTKAEVIAEAITDETGGFSGMVPKELLKDTAKETIRVEAITEPGGAATAAEEISVAMKPGEVGTVDVTLPTGKKIADRLAAAKAIKESLSHNVEVVESKISSMKRSHTGLTEFSALTRDGLKNLRADLGEDAPLIAAAVPVGEIEAPERTKPPRRRPPTPPVKPEKPEKPTEEPAEPTEEEPKPGKPEKPEEKPSKPAKKPRRPRKPKKPAKKAIKKKAVKKTPKKASTKKTATKKATAKKKAAMKAAKTSAAKKAAAKKSAAKKAAAKKAAAKKAAAKKKATAKTAAKKPAAKKSSTKSAAKKAAAKKAVAKKAAKKSVAKKIAAKKSSKKSVKKSTAKKTTKKAAKKGIA